MRYITLHILILWSFCAIGQTNLLPDESFENGSISGSYESYYNYEAKTLWRAWPFIGFEIDTEVKRTGSRSLKIAFRDYGNGTPTFRNEYYPDLDAGKYQFSFYYKTDVDRAGETITVDVHDGRQGSSSSIGEHIVTIISGAKDDFVQLLIEFEVDDSYTTFLPYIRIPYLENGAYLNIDDVKLVKLATEAKPTTPSPKNEATAITSFDVQLQWLKGITAVKSNVYLGTSSDDLEQVATDITDSQVVIDDLENDTKYFWRVDEIEANDNVIVGDVWCFTTKSFYDEYMSQVQSGKVKSETKVKWTQFGPGNAGFSNFLRYHPLLPDFCVESPDMGNTYQTEDNGKSWKTIKDVDGEGNFFRLYDLQYSTKTEKYAVAIESSRLYFSQDTARSWTEIKKCPWYSFEFDGGRDGRSWYRKVSAVAIDPSNNFTWYVGAGNFCRGQQQLWSTVNNPTAANPRGNENIYDNIKYQGKIWKTTDAGTTWTELTQGLDEKAQFSRIIVHPTNSNIVFAGSQYGLFRSTDAGATWTNIGEGKLDNNTIMDMDYYFDKSSGRFVLYVADQVRYHGNGQTTRSDGGIFKSDDNGATWQNINGNLGLDINRLTGGVSDNYYQYIAKWFDITTAEARSKYPTLPTAALQYFNSLNVDPSEENGLYVGFYDAQIQKSIIPGRLWKTTDGGTSWINIARDFGPAWENDKDYWIERNNPYNDNMEEGHQLSNQQWGQNYPLRSLRYCAVNTRGDVMLIYAHNTFVSTDKGETFKQVNETYTSNGNIMGTGDSNLPGQCIFQDRRLGEGILYLGSGEHHLWRSTNDGVDGKQAVKYIPQTQESVFAISTHPWDVNTVYTTSMRQKHLDRIYKSTDGAETFEDWGKATEAEEWMWTNSIIIDPIQPNYMYFGVTQVAGSGGGSGTDGPDKDKEGGFHKSTDSGKIFTPSNNGMPTKMWVQELAFDPRDSTYQSIFAAAPWNEEVRKNGGLFHTTDRGNNWTKIKVADYIEGINSVTFDHTGRLYVTAGRRAGDVKSGGLYYSDDYGQSWTKVFESQFIEFFDVSPFDRNLLVISQGVITANPGFYLSNDGGETWIKSNHTVGQPDNINQVEFDVNDPTVLWAAVMGSGFYKGEIEGGEASRQIILTPGTATLEKQETLELEVETFDILGEIKYKSANNTIASVSKDGIVTAHKRGAVKIWATSEDDRYSDFVYLVVLGDDTDPPLSIEDTKTSDFLVYPNPVRDILYLKGNSINEPMLFNVYTITGTLVSSQTIQGTGKIDVSKLRKGLYIYKAKGNTTEATGKFIKR
ncbi:T9SS type A sorting domain-containing protein [Flammeovirga sp. MY04]|uniref:VPS10 domain-containing protein n=1 Tax=Flammeovirga sp. MY04 TaxID=1191459 RepID=UPI0008061C85|nr:T9SS type A sorting domain-containing protein [Flammeovirga sp. MY04]ANQ51840.1 T9SS type A sorting domain-containing protein [Flammeovirga sp. MY04]